MPTIQRWTGLFAGSASSMTFSPSGPWRPAAHRSRNEVESQLDTSGCSCYVLISLIFSKQPAHGVAGERRAMTAGQTAHATSHDEPRPASAARHDGWDGDRKAIFLHRLA